MSQALSGGFGEPVFAAQNVFRVVMDALARPGTLQPLVAEAVPPAPLTPELGALALTLLDHDTPIWLDPLLAAAPQVAEWLRFHTGAPVVIDSEFGEAIFAIIVDPLALPSLDRFAPGTDEYPDRSTTLLIAVESLTGGPRLTLSGPGIESTAELAPCGLPANFPGQWAENHSRFPRGIDIVLVAEAVVVGLPRSTKIVEG